MNTPMPTPGARPQRGFTLIELMITIGVMAILFGVAAPSIRDFLMNVRMGAIVNDMMSDLALARSQAIKVGATVMICPSPAPHTNCSGTNYGVGWMVFVDANGDNIWSGTATEPAIKTHGPAPVRTQFGNFTVVTANVPAAGGIAYLRYRPTGVNNTNAVVAPSVTFCDRRGVVNPGLYPRTGRQILISATGRAVVTRPPAPC